MIERLTSLDPFITPPWKFKNAFPRADIPEKEVWRAHLLRKLVLARQEADVSCKDSTEIQMLLDSLCSS